MHVIAVCIDALDDIIDIWKLIVIKRVKLSYWNVMGEDFYAFQCLTVITINLFIDNQCNSKNFEIWVCSV